MLDLVRIEKALDVFMARASRKGLAYQHKERLARLWRPKFFRVSREFLDWYEKEVGRSVDRDWHNAGELLKFVDWELIQEKLGTMFKPVWLEALGAMGLETERSLGIRKFDLINDKAVKWAQKQSSKLITIITEDTRGSIRWSISEGLKGGRSIQGIARTIRPLIGLNGPQARAFDAYRLELEAEGFGELEAWGKLSRYANHALIYRAETIARTETASSLAEGQVQAFAQNDIAEADWVSDPEACAICIAAVADNPYKVSEIEGMIPAHPRCFAGNTLVIAPELRTAYSGVYDGPILRIGFGCGMIFITPNHNLFTSRGLVPAKGIREGDEIVYYPGFKGMAVGNPDDQRSPARIDEVVATFTEAPSMAKVCVKIAAEDFHGDGAFMDGEVDIVATNRLLKRQRQPAGFGLHGKRQLGERYPQAQFLAGQGNLLSVFEGLSLAAHCEMGRGRQLPSTTPGRDLRPHHASSPGVPPSLDAGHLESASDDVPRYSELLGEALLRFPGQITLRKITDIQEIFPGRIPVYDLHTASLSYLAEGVQASNCECTWVARV